MTDETLDRANDLKQKQSDLRPIIDSLQKNETNIQVLMTGKDLLKEDGAKAIIHNIREMVLKFYQDKLDITNKEYEELK